MGECFIFGAGAFWGLPVRPEPGDILIAADGGYIHCRREGLEPEILVGDFDSLPQVPEGLEILRLPVEKDDTDLLAAIRLGLRRGCRTFRIFGGTGGSRPEHTMANYQCLLFLARRGAVGFLYGDGYLCTVLKDGALTLPARRSGNVSVFSLDGEARGVTIRGLKYPLQNAVLAPDMPLGVSNSFVGKDAELFVEDGALLIFYDLPEKC